MVCRWCASWTNAWVERTHQRTPDGWSEREGHAVAPGIYCRQSIYSRLAGYEDVDDAERPAQDPTFRLVGSDRIWERGSALTSQLQSFETELLTQEENLSGLEAIDLPQRVMLNMDSTEIPVEGQQEKSAYNGQFESTCYHPLLLFNGEGDCLAAKLRPGNVNWELERKL
jgi:DDE family transposase